MRLWVVLTTASTVAAAAFAHAVNYVDEGFGQGVPPAGWNETKSGPGAGWDPEEGGPWGTYAVGWASSSADAERWARMDTFAFDVTGAASLTWRFNYEYGHGGFESDNSAKFTLLYPTQPEEIISSRTIELASDWRVLSGSASIPHGGNVVGRFDVWVKNRHPRHVAVYSWRLDNVVIYASEPAVSPTSLGRVRALFR